jgi:DNA gyrase subunit A
MENAMEIGLVQKIDIDLEMQQAYLDYAMSVIVSRALPDARDGLKPVHRRILYAMHDMGVRADSPYKKSARIVGEVLGKYHPHSDVAVYDAMARMAQDFSMRYLLVDGQGNFGSIDGDPPAAMRYTEARLANLANYMLADIGKNTVDFSDNFDGSLTEPSVLPSAVPNLLVNGASGIAVGMSTSIPPHNLGEVVDASKFMLDNWEKLDDVSLDDLMKFIHGPDFPTGGIILHAVEGDGLLSAYGSGRGRITVQAKAHLEEMERGRSRIIITELPYMTNKSSLIERIASLARDERIEGIADLRDESDRQGMRIVIELTKTTDPEGVLRDLYKSTPMQSTFSMIMLALVDGEPRLLGLKQALRVYLEHRLEIIRRRSQYDLEKARQRAHILEGLLVALKNLDEVISMIRRSPDADTARGRLMRKYKLSDLQAQAILDMPLKRLASLERKKIEDEYKELVAQIKSLESLLRSPRKMRQVAADELLAVKDTYGDKRRTQIVQLKEGEPKVALLTATDLTPEQTVWLSVTEDGLISRTSDDKQPRPSGKDVPFWLVQANTRDTLYLVDDQGETAAVTVHSIPEQEKPSDGMPVHKVSPLTENNILATLFTVPPKNERNEAWFVTTVTRQGMIKRSSLAELPGPSANTFILARVNQGDRLAWVRLSDGKGDVLMMTADGMAIRFSEDDVRPMGLVAAGVMGIKLQARDEVIAVEILPQPGEVFVVASDGTAKRIKVEQFPRQGRYGQGVTTWKLPAKVRAVGMAVGKGTTRVTLHLFKLAAKSARLDDAPLLGRSARGKSIQELKDGDEIVSLTVPWETPRPLASASAKPPAPKPSSGSSGSTTKRSSSRSRASSPSKSARSSTRKPATTETAAKTSTRKTGASSKSSGSSKSSSRPSGSRKPAAQKPKPAAPKPGATKSRKRSTGGS